MKVRRLMLTILIIGICVGSLGFSSQILSSDNVNTTIFENDIRCISIHPHNNSTIFVGTSKAVYKSENKGKDYSRVLQLQGANAAVNDLFLFDQFAYAATDVGLYKSSDLGNSWSRIYSSSNDLARKSLSIIREGEFEYLGTGKGLFFKKNNESSWRQINGKVDRQPVYQIEAIGNYIYFSTNNYVYRIEKDTHETKRIFSAGLLREDSEYVYEDENSYEFITPSIQTFELFGDENKKIIVVSDRGAYFSQNFGESWEEIFLGSMFGKEITSLLVFNSDFNSHGRCEEDPLKCMDILVGGKRGTFYFDGSRLEYLGTENESSQVACLEKDADGAVYVATDQGVFTVSHDEMLPLFNKVSEDAMDRSNALAIEIYTQNYFDKELSIREVQEIAIKYAEVHPDKIKQWRELSLKKAWLPDLSIGFDGDKNRTVSDSVYGSYSSGGQHYIAPNDKTFYDNLGWGISLSWDLGDVLWSTEQTTIDSRSKAMVELREDILDQITRLYFERRRLQLEEMTSDKQGISIGIDKKIRIDELTAIIDGFTGGAFSNHGVGIRP